MTPLVPVATSFLIGMPERKISSKFHLLCLVTHVNTSTISTSLILKFPLTVISLISDARYDQLSKDETSQNNWLILDSQRVSKDI